MMSVPVASPDLAGIERGVVRRTFGRVRDLQVELAGQVVVLRGKVATYYTKQLAQHGALDALDGQRLVNEIVVG